MGANFMKKLAFGAVAAAMVACLGSAQAGVITFDEPINSPFAPFAPFFGDGDEFYQSDFWLQPFSNAAEAQPGDLVGAVVDGSDPFACSTMLCPTGNASNYYASLNDGVLALGHLGGNFFRVNGFDASFLGNGVGALPAVAGLLRLQGIRANGTSITQTYLLDGPDANGNLGFDSYLTTGAFRTTNLVMLFAFGFACNELGTCNAFTTNRGQFALDNLDVSVIPEPASLALATLSLGLMGAVHRRRRVVAA